MKLISISIKDTRILLRDRRALLVLIAMPFVIITILGLALGSLWSGDSGVSKFNVAVVDHDGGDVAGHLTKDILQSKDMKKLLVVQKMGETQARKDIASGDLASAIIIPKEFSTKVQAGKKASFTVLSDPGQEIRAGIVRSIADSFAANVSAISIATKTPLTALLQAGVIPPAEINKYVQKLAADAGQALKKPQVKVGKSTTSRDKEVSAMQYYSAGIGVMFILFGAMFGAFSLLDERRNMTLARLLSSPTSRVSILGGKLGGIFLIGVIQFAVLVASTRLIFGVDWGDSWLGLIALTVCTVLAATGMAIFIASIAKTNKSAAAVSQIMIQGMAALGGSMIPLMQFPAWMQNASRFTVNYWGISGFRDLMLGKGFSAVVTPCLVLLGIAILFMAVGALRFKYE
jgi:ABC-2 type transport system permease protein